MISARHRITWRVLLLLAAAASVIPSAAQQAGGDTANTLPPPTEIENRLLIQLNQARIERGLHPVLMNPALQEIARGHSRDMAELAKLSHSSPSGETYTDRLAEAEIWFAEHAENVAFSETYVAEIIHRSLMGSPGHRENILNANFDTVGIGVILAEGGGYFITQDFIRILSTGPAAEAAPKSEESRPAGAPEMEAHLKEIARQTQAWINDRRRSKGLPPFRFTARANSLAEQFARSRAEGLPAPLLPPDFRRIQVLHLFVTAPSLESATPELKLFLHHSFGSGGMGVRFARTAEHPGGAYFFAFLLLLDLHYSEMSADDHRDLVLEQINLQRLRAGRRALAAHSWLSGEALRISQTLQQGESLTRISSSLLGYRIETYVTEDPLKVPDRTSVSISRAGIRKLGLGVAYEPDPNLPSGTFWVTLIYR
jgi:uncharacterized protein YkwD